jgi:hypothetical protein
LFGKIQKAELLYDQAIQQAKKHRYIRYDWTLDVFNKNKGWNGKDLTF